jgi:hypothetical protein
VTKKTDKLTSMIRAMAEELVEEQMKAVLAERSAKEPKPSRLDELPQPAAQESQCE